MSTVATVLSNAAICCGYVHSGDFREESSFSEKLFTGAWWLDCLLLQEGGTAALGDCWKCFLLLRSLWVFDTPTHPRSHLHTETQSPPHAPAHTHIHSVTSRMNLLTHACTHARTLARTHLRTHPPY